ncbi:MAG: hypothetical protein VW378_02170 [bacterium]
MIKKIFTTIETKNENLILESILEHSRLDGEELCLLKKIIDLSSHYPLNELESLYSNICKINADAKDIFKHIYNKIKQYSVDNRKGVEILHLHLKVEQTSAYILKSAQHILIYTRLEQQYPKQIFDRLTTLCELISTMHLYFNLSLEKYSQNKYCTSEYISKIIDVEILVRNHHLESLQFVLEHANKNTLPLGSIRCLENLLSGLEDIASVIFESTVALECLLLN